VAGDCCAAEIRGLLCGRRKWSRMPVRIESDQPAFFLEKRAFRDAVKSSAGVKLFAESLYSFLYGGGGSEDRFERWCQAIAKLPQRQTRVLTWPMVTLWGFLAPTLISSC
jgi:hypothetical protein